ncbi:uncharacterized protein HMPREF1541_03416 [Cyphellophora europaea CBS 101466]|uniref:Uncharacterized protein n=1 Tax=Cyphellophora europaea (strain CBS 101466) TaxID=1220924 RepID=W2RYS8_CYPE1|nr:uncharacterized protein HMPREF1541_03416 [Cyphellophora europaea CBS 101466]ETN41480.1 hypothetical protein HMPREF1541_03416 [Cyphellophora europaea CBS 101466]
MATDRLNSAITSLATPSNPDASTALSRGQARWTKPQSRTLDTTSLGPKCLCAGLWRCQTSTLQLALETVLGAPHLPFRPSMHGSVIMTDLSLLRLAVRATKEQNPATRRKLVAQLYRGFNGSADFPGFALLPDLLDLYPDMRVVLNKRRGAAEWARSADVLRFWSSWTYVLVCGLIPMCWTHWRLYREFDALARRRFGAETDIWSAGFYDVHNEWVREECRKRGREVLEWEAGDGWAPLCGFLGVEVPPEGVGVPVSNEGKEIQALKPWAVKMGLGVWAVVLGVGAVGVWTVRWWLG